MARTYQNIRLFPDLTAIENIMVGLDARRPESLLGALLATPAHHRRMVREAIARASEAAAARSGSPAGGIGWPATCPMAISGGWRSPGPCRSSPVLLLLDEPAAGMNPVESHAMLELIRSLRDSHGLTILLIEHQMRVVMGISERISVLDHGACIAEGTPAEIRADPAVITAYLGARAAKHGIDAAATLA